MRKAKCAPAIALLVLGAACSGGPTNPAIPEPELEISLTAADVAFVEGSDLGTAFAAAGTVASVRLAGPLAISGRARGQWQMSASKEGDAHRARGELRLRARTAAGEEMVVRARIRRAVLRDDGKAMRFVAVASLQHGDVGYGARLRGTIIDGGRLRLQLFFRSGDEGHIVGRVETFEVR